MTLDRQVISLESTSLQRYKRLKDKVEIYSAGNVNLLIANTVMDTLNILNANEVLVAERNDRKWAIKLPLDITFDCFREKPSIVLDVMLEELDGDNEDFSTGGILLEKETYELLESAVPLYEDIKEQVEGRRIEEPSLEDVFIYGITTLKGLCDMNTRGYKTELTMNKRTSSFKYAIPVNLTAGSLLEKLYKEWRQFTRSYEWGREHRFPSQITNRVERYLKAIGEEKAGD